MPPEGGRPLGHLLCIKYGSSAHTTCADSYQNYSNKTKMNRSPWAAAQTVATAKPDSTTFMSADNAVLASAPVQKRMGEFSMEAMPGTPEQFKAFARAEAKRWGEIIQSVGIKLD